MPRPKVVRVLLAGLLIGSAVVFVFATSAERHKEHVEQRTEAARRAEAVPSTTTVRAAEPSPTGLTTTVAATAPATGGGDPDRGNEHSSPTGNSATTVPSLAHDSDGSAETATTSAAQAASETPGDHTGADQQRGAEAEKAEKAETLFGVKTESTTTTTVAVALSLFAAGAALRVRRDWLWTIVAFAAAFTALDGREASHQANLGRGGLEAIALILAVAHAAASIAAVVAASSRRLEPAARPVAS